MTHPNLPNIHSLRRAPSNNPGGESSVGGDITKDTGDGVKTEDKENSRAPLVLKAAELFAYCSSLFVFDSYTVKRFR